MINQNNDFEIERENEIPQYFLYKILIIGFENSKFSALLCSMQSNTMTSLNNYMTSPPDSSEDVTAHDDVTTDDVTPIGPHPIVLLISHISFKVRGEKRHCQTETGKNPKIEILE